MFIAFGPFDLLMDSMIRKMIMFMILENEGQKRQVEMKECVDKGCRQKVQLSNSSPRILRWNLCLFFKLVSSF